MIDPIQAALAVVDIAAYQMWIVTWHQYAEKNFEKTMKKQTTQNNMFIA